MKIKKELEKFWKRTFTDVQVNKQYEAVSFTNKLTHVSIPFEDLEDYV